MWAAESPRHWRRSARQLWWPEERGRSGAVCQVASLTCSLGELQVYKTLMSLPAPVQVVDTAARLRSPDGSPLLTAAFVNSSNPPPFEPPDVVSVLGSGLCPFYSTE
jgi:hypothetical protein